MPTSRLCERQGNATLIALLVLMLLSAIGLAAVSQSKMETQIVGNTLLHKQALLNADAGWAEAVARFGTEALAPPTPTKAPGWGTYLVASSGKSSLDPSYAAAGTDGLDNDLDKLIDESGEHYPEGTVKLGDSAMDYPWVRVTFARDAQNKVILYGDHDNNPATLEKKNIVRGLPVYAITSEGVRGTSRRIVQVEYCPGGISPHSALYAEGPDVDWSEATPLVSGRDWDPVSGSVIVGAPEVPGLATTMDPAAEITQLLSHGYTGVQCEGEGPEPSIVASTQDLDLAALRDKYAPRANLVLSTEVQQNQTWGTRDDMKIVYRPGNIKIEGVTGAGLLIVDGQFEAKAGFTWHGVIISRGSPSTDVTLLGDGPGIRIYGAFLFGGEGGGNGELQKDTRILYSSENIRRLNGRLKQDEKRPDVISWREL